MVWANGPACLSQGHSHRRQGLWHGVTSVNQAVRPVGALWSIMRECYQGLRTLDYKGLHWQTGYAASSVSRSNVEQVIQYIRDQESHHRQSSFQDELRALLTRHEISFDERHVWVSESVRRVAASGPRLGATDSRGECPWLRQPGPLAQERSCGQLAGALTNEMRRLRAQSGNLTLNARRSPRFKGSRNHKLRAAPVFAYCHITRMAVP